MTTELVAHKVTEVHRYVAHQDTMTGSKPGKLYFVYAASRGIVQKA